MELRHGELCQNKTLKYLVPSLLFYGEEFRQKLNSIFTLSFGIHDTLLDGSYLDEGQRLIYILNDKNVRPKIFQSVLIWIKYQPYYVADYSFDDLELGNKHMIVIEYPVELSDVYDKFKEGKYSKMYTKEEIKKYISNQDTLCILNRGVGAKEKFANQVFSTFQVKLNYKDLQFCELDFPPKKEDETFNYKQEQITI